MCQVKKRGHMRQKRGGQCWARPDGSSSAIEKKSTLLSVCKISLLLSSLCKSPSSPVRRGVQRAAIQRETEKENDGICYSSQVFQQQRQQQRQPISLCVGLFSRCPPLDSFPILLFGIGITILHLPPIHTDTL